MSLLKSLKNGPKTHSSNSDWTTKVKFHVPACVATLRIYGKTANLKLRRVLSALDHIPQDSSVVREILLLQSLDSLQKLVAFNRQQLNGVIGARTAAVLLVRRGISCRRWGSKLELLDLSAQVFDRVAQQLDFVEHFLHRSCCRIDVQRRWLFTVAAPYLIWYMLELF